MNALSPRSGALSRVLLDVLIRAGLIAALAMFCFDLFRPFLNLVMWSLILAVTLYPLHQRLAARLGQRRVIASIILVALGLVCLIAPVGLLGASIAETIRTGVKSFEAGQLELPAPPASVEQWPMVGEPLYSLWLQASQNLTWAFQQLMPHLKGWSGIALHHAAGIGTGIVTFLLALLIAGWVMAEGAAGRRVAEAIASRLFNPALGPQMVDLCTSTIRAVAQGVVGIAFIQMVLLGVGFVVMGIPLSGLLALIILLMGIVQLPVVIVVVPVVIYAFAHFGSGVGTIAFAVWTVLAGLAEHVLKPLLLGRGVAVPMPVILIGALGGMISNGIIGLFIGPVMLAVGYALFNRWVQGPEPVPSVILPAD
ncbi:AI-2E family transporter [Pseudomonas sp. HR96]|uniref:AI-2E family transporter n=1 Tax=Pseudomonas sp. HR96 TaxID=1027966 RepID=UPI002A75021D|nr:AI-2E family transporter [Pseudomonas sp. HR96]WPP01705.1 AI-2E family transporter [Pseudomonas sp. HR96]